MLQCHVAEAFIQSDIYMRGHTIQAMGFLLLLFNHCLCPSNLKVFSSNKRVACGVTLYRRPEIILSVKAVNLHLLINHNHGVSSTCSYIRNTPKEELVGLYSTGKLFF